MVNVLVMVCDSSGARLFHYDRKIKQLINITDIDNPEGRLNDKDMESSPHGAKMSHKGSWGHGALASDKQSKTHQKVIFAKYLNEFLKNHLNNDTQHKLYIIAPAGFMGCLRESMPHKVKESIQHEIVKDLVKFKAELVRRHLPQYL